MAKKQTTAVMLPIRRAPSGVTNPAAGVTPTRPATAPVAAPTAVALPRKAASMMSQVKVPAAAPVLVATKATVARPPEASALPALNPNQPNHSKPAPSKIKGTL